MGGLIGFVGFTGYIGFSGFIVFIGSIGFRHDLMCHLTLRGGVRV